MARKIGMLTALAVSQVKRRGYYSDGGGLYLQVGPTGGKSWVYRYRQAGRLRELGLGPAHTVSLALARRRSQECRLARLEGRDLIGERRAARVASESGAAKTLAFREAAESYIASHRAGWRNRTSEHQWRQSLTDYAFPVFGALPVSAIDTTLVTRVLEPIWTSKPETASRLRGRMEAVLDWAATRGYREGPNPARWRGHLQNLLPRPSRVRAVVHHPALPYSEIPEFMAGLRAQETTAARALEFLVLTAARVGEVLGARWSEFDLKQRVWTIPPARMKSGREHRAPLSDRALEIIEGMAGNRQSEFVFAASGGPLNRLALRSVGRADATTHGFRSSFRDWAAERTNFPSQVAEMALAHAVSDKVEAAYRRGDLFQKRCRLAEAWAKFCNAPGTPRPVVPMRQSGSSASA
jgi:integrase